MLVRQKTRFELGELAPLLSLRRRRDGRPGAGGGLGGHAGQAGYHYVARAGSARQRLVGDAVGRQALVDSLRVSGQRIRNAAKAQAQDQDTHDGTRRNDHGAQRARRMKGTPSAAV